MLSFEEFLAGTNREQNKKDQAEKQAEKQAENEKLKVNKKKTTKFSDNDDIIDNKTNKINDENRNNNDETDDISKSKNESKKTQSSSSFFNSIGEFLEMHQMQAFIIVMITLDSFASFTEMWLNSYLLKNPYSSIPNINIDGSDINSIQSILSNIDMTVYISILKSITTFTIFFSAIEISLVLAIFGVNVIGHYGYLIDALIVASQLYLEIKGFGRETRILNIFRFWRFVRLFGSMVK
jgi:ATP-dependent 26S proteasome regulatory subunit